MAAAYKIECAMLVQYRNVMKCTMFSDAPVLLFGMFFMNVHDCKTKVFVKFN